MKRKYARLNYNQIDAKIKSLEAKKKKLQAKEDKKLLDMIRLIPRNEFEASIAKCIGILDAQAISVKSLEKKFYVYFRSKA